MKIVMEIEPGVANNLKRTNVDKPFVMHEDSGDEEEDDEELCINKYINKKQK